MNLLHVTPYYAPAWAFGGVVQAVAGLAEAQAARGHRVTVQTTDALDRSRRVSVREETIGGVRVLRRPNLLPGFLGRWNLSAPLAFGLAVDRSLREDSVELVHVHELRTLENVLAAPGIRRVGTPMVVSPHGTLPYRTGRGFAKKMWDRTLGRRLISSIDQVTCLTVTEADDARWLWSSLGVPLGDDQIAVVPNGVKMTPPLPAEVRLALRKKWRLGTGPVVLFLGRLAKRKGLPLLVSAFATLSQEFPNVRLLLVGPDEGSLPTLTGLVRHLGLQTRVTFTGLLTGEEKAEALAVSDLLVLPSTGEGLSMAALEALASGLPVILTEGQGFEAVTAAGAGLITDPEVEPLAETIRSLLADPPRCRLMGRLGREVASSTFSWSRIAAQMDEVYETVLRRKGRAGR